MSMNPYLQAIGLRNVDDQTSEQLLDIIAETVVNTALVSASRHLDQNKRSEAVAIWRNGQPEELFMFFRAHNIDFPAVIRAELEALTTSLQQAGKRMRGEND